MMHTNRVWSVAHVETAPELAAKLTRGTWVLCTGFQLGDSLLCLNDSTSEDAIQEYAFLRFLDGQWTQVESITVGWCNAAKALEYVRSAAGGENDSSPFRSAVTPKLDGSQSHRCPLCA